MTSVRPILAFACALALLQVGQDHARAQATGDAPAAPASDSEAAEDGGTSTATLASEGTAELFARQEVSDCGLPGYTPLQRFSFARTRLSFPVTLGERFDAATPVRLDADGTEWSPSPALSSHLRLGLVFDSLEAFDDVHLTVQYEHQVASGTHTGGVANDPTSAPGQPLARGTDHQLRQASVGAQMGEQMRLLAGITTSHWGMGVLANDGAQYWRPGSATFGDPNQGDVVARAGFLAGPFTSKALVVGASADWVYSDDILVGDERAFQIVALAALAPGQPTSLGAYVVVRRQQAPDGRELNVQVVDVAGNHRLELGGLSWLDLRGEAVMIAGSTTLTRNLAAARHTVLQGGFALSANAHINDGGAVLDVYYASGDRNPDDGRQTGFRFDPEFRAGLLLFETVLAAQTARGAALAGDPALVGQPADGLERFPTHGSVSNTVALYPRGYWRWHDALEFYGGVLFAWSAVPPVDPYNTRIAGGELRSALGGAPGRYYGTELNLGARFQWLMRGGPAHNSEVTLGLEGALLMPGDAIVDLRGADTGVLVAVHGSALYRF